MSTAQRHDVERVVWPRGKKMVDYVDLARRLPSLDGKTIGFLWDYVFRGNEIFSLIEQELNRRFSGLKLIPYHAFGATFGGDEHRTVTALADNLERYAVDAVVSGIGG